MHLVEVDLSHQEMLTNKFRLLGASFSEYNFANIYLFRGIHQYKLYFRNDLFIKGMARDGSTFLLPTFSLAKHFPSSECKDWLHEVDYLFPIPEEWLPYFDSSIFKFSYSENDSDYLYSREKMQQYPGRHLDGMRNLVKHFLATYAVESYPLTRERAADALLILDQWQHVQDPDEGKTDYGPCKEALSLMDVLQLNGQIVYVDHTPAGFILGQFANHNQYLVHFMKANKSLKGIYQYLYQALANALPDTVKFLNLEQDLGIPQVRQNKQSYQPNKLLHKYRIYLDFK